MFGNLFNRASNYFGNLYDRGKQVYNNYFKEPEGDKAIPAAVRRFLNEHGDEQITSLRVARTPISSALNGLLNLVSLGGFDKGKQAQNVDEFFHLFFVINEKYQVEKNQLVKISNYKRNDREESIGVPEPHIPIREFLMNGAAGNPSSYWGEYKAFGSNCGNWVMRTLQANNISSPEISSFVQQPIDKLVPQIGQHTEQTANFLTDLGAKLDTGIQDLTNGLVSFKKGGLVKKKRKNIKKK
jgi:hypothetical protein